MARRIYPEGVSEKLMKVAHVELLDNLLKFEIASSVWYFYKFMEKGAP